MRALHVRLTLVFLAILLALGASSLRLAQVGAEARSLELTQRLNEPVARYMVENVDFATADGLSGEALAELAPHVMTINPSVEVYLLDPTGLVVAQASTLNSIRPRRVDLAPVRRFLANDAEYPLLGDDPADPDDPRPFSTWPVHRDGRLQGYVYAVLGGEQYASLAQALDGSRAARELAAMLGGAVLLAGLAGALVFFTLTRRLRELTARVGRAPVPGAAHGGPRDGSSDGSRAPRDELDELARAYGALTARLRAQYATLERSDADRRHLIASVSHDLRTPLTTLEGYIETLQLGEGTLGPDERRRYLAIAHRHARKLAARVDELFELSRLSAEGAAARLERFSLRELAHDCLQDFAPLARDRRVALDVVVDGADAEDAFAIDADIALVQRTLENLVDNALRHVPDGGRIAIRLRRADASRVRLDVLDTGCGMAPEVASRVFESCWTGRAGERGRGGLGLAIAARAVELHGGRISVASRPGVGTRFSVELPSGAGAGTGPRSGAVPLSGFA